MSVSISLGAVIVLGLLALMIAIIIDNLFLLKQISLDPEAYYAHQRWLREKEEEDDKKE